MEFRVLESILETVAGQNNAVVIDMEIDRQLVLPVKATGASIFHKWEDRDKEIQYLEKNYENIYLITSDNILDNNRLQLVNSFQNKTWSDIPFNEQAFTKYPIGYEIQKNILQVYRLCLNQNIYN